MHKFKNIEDLKVFMRLIFAMQLVVELADDCINRKILVQKDKQDTKRCLEGLIQRNQKNFIDCYNMDPEMYVPLSTVVEKIIEGIGGLSMEELLTFKLNIHEYIKDSREKTILEFDRIRAGDVPEDNQEKISES